MIKLAKVIKQTVLTTTALLAINLLLAFVLLPSASAGAKPPIPPGCPGSTGSGQIDTSKCDAEPAGCPGSSKGTEPADPKKFDAAHCTYQATCASSSGLKDPGYSSSTEAYCSCDSSVTTPAQANDQGCILSSTVYNPDGSVKGCDSNNCKLVEKYLNPIFKLVSSLVGLIVVLSLVLGGVQYASAGPDPQKVTKAKNRIVKAVVALVCYIFLYAFIQYFLVPGGLF